ncbi:thiopurine S-methyltransferase [Azomonas macrocytogenes]|uniref:thiopurine S-methyltransferase n=1 Tax=Azomonas macrocytogenes TaxID=69962 RepID=A0A839SZK3_AZOMA|nr:thiopurine S-methyltransferase [Azomonas macrocytogenes]MBB3102757.1 thiopurine S-methyltransferase [Azomonas macrocytogenes]
MNNQQRWKAKWKKNDIAFHQDNINPLLEQFWPQLSLSTGDTVLVPLCGKSLDMNWLSLMGYKVIGIEFSDIAIKAYFDALSVTPSRQQQGRFTRWWHGDTEIWRGDLFNLAENDVREVSAIYDCAALTALSPSRRIKYVQHIANILPEHGQILLLTTESTNEEQIDSASEIDEEVNDLYKSLYTIKLLYGQHCIKKDPAYPDEPASALEEKVYWMKTHTHNYSH